MTPALFHLVTTGHLMATECALSGWPVMTCTTCQGPVDLIWRHEPMNAESLRSARTIPGCVWGEDVTVICPCCSFPHCGHQMKHRGNA